METIFEKELLFASRDNNRAMPTFALEFDQYVSSRGQQQIIMKSAWSKSDPVSLQISPGFAVVLKN